MPILEQGGNGTAEMGVLPRLTDKGMQQLIDSLPRFLSSLHLDLRNNERLTASRWQSGNGW